MKTFLKSKKGLLFIYVLIIALIITNVLVIKMVGKLARPEVKDVVVIREDGTSRAIDLPFKEVSTENKDYTYTGTLVLKKHFFKIYHIIADDCVKSITINDTPVDLSSFRDDQLCNWSKGFQIKLGHYLKPGDNHFEIQVRDNGGMYAFNIINDAPGEPLYLPYIIIALLLISVFVYITLIGPFKLTHITAVIFVLGLIVRIVYISQTAIDERGHDVWPHIDYIKYVAENKAFPNPMAGWEYHQPPLYYITGAFVYNTTKVFYPKNPLVLLPYLQTLYFLAFLLCGIMILKLLNLNKVLYYIGVGLLVFWPSGFLHTPRVGNDNLVYFLTAFSLFFIIKWFQEDEKKDEEPVMRSPRILPDIIVKVWHRLSAIFKMRRNKNLYLAVLLASLGVTAKATAVVLIGLIGILFLIRWFIMKNEKESMGRKIILMGLIIFIGFTIYIADNIYYSIKENKHWLMGQHNSDVTKEPQYTGDHLVNYIYFDVPNMLTKALAGGYDRNDTRYYWNYLLKTSITEAFDFPTKYHQNCGYLLNLTLFIIVLFLLIGLVFVPKTFFDRANLVLVLFGVLTLVSHLYFVIGRPLSCHINFRFIYPLIIPIICLYCSIIRHIGGKFFLLKYIGYITPVLFSITAGIFYFLVILI